MSRPETLRDRYRSQIADLAAAVEADDESAFRGAFERLRAALNEEFNPELRRLTENAKSALRRFREQARIDALAEEVPDARKRLSHVVKLTDEAAHRTLDLVDQSGPLVEQTSRAAARLIAEWNAFGERRLALESDWPERTQEFLGRARADADKVRGLLSEVLLAQGYQDLTGQIIRGIIALVSELEAVLAQLVALANGEDTRRMPALNLQAMANDLYRGAGPQVPGVSTHTGALAGQDDIDALIASVAAGK
jgi:chemotaxis protein CheZ